MLLDLCVQVWVTLHCVSAPSGWPWVVCPADAYPHPDHCVCSQPDDGLQPTLQSEQQAVSTRYSKT